MSNITFSCLNAKILRLEIWHISHFIQLKRQTNEVKTLKGIGGAWPKMFKNFKLTCIICNLKISNYVSGATFVVCVSLAFTLRWRFLWSSFTLHVQSFSKLRSVLPLSIHRLQNSLKASGLELFLRLLEEILNSCNKNFAFCRGACSTHVLQWNRDATVHSQYRMAQTSQGKNCARKVWILNSWLEFHHFKKALLKNCQRLWWTISTWLFLDIFILRIYYITDKITS